MKNLVQATIVRSKTLRKHFIGYSNKAYEQSVQMATAEHERAACIAGSSVDKNREMTLFSCGVPGKSSF